MECPEQANVQKEIRLVIVQYKEWGREMELSANGYLSSQDFNKNVLKQIVVMFLQLCEHAKSNLSDFSNGLFELFNYHNLYCLGTDQCCLHPGILTRDIHTCTKPGSR